MQSSCEVSNPFYLRQRLRTHRLPLLLMPFFLVLGYLSNIFAPLQFDKSGLYFCNSPPPSPVPLSSNFMSTFGFRKSWFFRFSRTHGLRDKSHCSSFNQSLHHQNMTRQQVQKGDARENPQKFPAWAARGSETSANTRFGASGSKGTSRINLDAPDLTQRVHRFTYSPRRQVSTGSARPK